MGLLVKRVLDGWVAALLLLILLPVLLLLALLVRASSPGPVLYVQERVGRRGRPFRMIKFRTMTVGSDAVTTRLHRDDPRITPVGRWLRRFSLDELPQLFNVLAGEMSLVGPRPAPTRVVERMSPAQRRRLAVRPGLTGWAQVQGRNTLPWADRIVLDLWYVDHWSLWLDLQILYRTVAVVLRGTGLYGPDGWNRGYR
ncbi:MAG TPA: sugar transferase [Symbiobacteriaceae bacterium]|nr:sugar transferase [Symbiobacteriaceae bacterium]